MEREKVLVKVPEAAARLGIGRSKAYELVRAGELPGVVKIGGMVRVSIAAIDRFIAEQTGSGSGSAN